MEPQENQDMQVDAAKPTEQPTVEGDTGDNPEGTEQPEQPKGRPISSLINQEFASTIQEMGFSKAVAEKSLLYTNNGSVEGAMEWITQHQEDPDFEQEEFLAEEPAEDPNKPKLTKEERIKAAMELQQRIRAKREAEDKKLEEERELQRIKGTKELQKAKRKMEEQQAALRLEMERKEKMEFLKEKKKMEELLRKEACERAGKKYVPGEEVKVKKKPSIQAVKDGMKIVNTLYTEERRPGVAKTCFKTFHTFCKNIHKDPTQDKFRAINLGNEKVAARIGKISGGIAMLKGVGFSETDDGNLFMEEEDVDIDLLKQAIDLVEMKM